MAPRMRFAMDLSFFARVWYWASWFVESRSHSALMSPVTMKLWAPFHLPRLLWFWYVSLVPLSSVPSTCHRTVVSSVLGNAFSKRRARSLSAMRSFMSSITFSTRSDLKVLHCFAGRWKGRRNGPSLYGGLERFPISTYNFKIMGKDTYCRCVEYDL